MPGPFLGACCGVKVYPRDLRGNGLPRQTSGTGGVRNRGGVLPHQSREPRVKSLPHQARQARGKGLPRRTPAGLRGDGFHRPAWGKPTKSRNCGVTVYPAKPRALARSRVAPPTPGTAGQKVYPTKPDKRGVKVYPAEPPRGCGVTVSTGQPGASPPSHGTAG